MEDKKIQKYELSFLLDKEEDVQAVMKHLTDNHAEIGVKGNVAHIPLSYPIKKHDKAYFGWVRFSMPTENAPMLVSALRLDSRVLRTLLIAAPFEKQDRPDFASRARTRKPETKEMSNEALGKKLASMKGEGK